MRDKWCKYNPLLFFSLHSFHYCKARAQFPNSLKFCQVKKKPQYNESVHLLLFSFSKYHNINFLKMLIRFYMNTKRKIKYGFLFILIDNSLFHLWVARLWIWCRAAGDRNAEMKINTGIYIFCSPAWLASSKCISDLNLNNRDQPLPALHSICRQEIPCCCHKENIFWILKERLLSKQHILRQIKSIHILLNVSVQTLNINQSSDWAALVSSEVWYYYIINYLHRLQYQSSLGCWLRELPVNLVTRQIYYWLEPNK